MDHATVDRAPFVRRLYGMVITEGLMRAPNSERLLSFAIATVVSYVPEIAPNRGCASKSARRTAGSASTAGMNGRNEFRELGKVLASLAG